MKGNFKTIVMLPKYADVMEWVAVNSAYLLSRSPCYQSQAERALLVTVLSLYPVFDFYTNLNQFYGVLAECCTQQSCPTMSAGPQCVCNTHLCWVYIDYLIG